MSCNDPDDMVVYILVHKLDKYGIPMLDVDIAFSHVPYEKLADIPESGYSDLMGFFRPLGVLSASHGELMMLSPYTRSIRFILMMSFGRQGLGLWLSLRSIQILEYTKHRQKPCRPCERARVLNEETCLIGRTRCKS